MTATVRDNALLLEVIAGPDGYDPRQYAPRVHPYTQLLEGGVRGLKIVVVKEGFGQPRSERDVDNKVRSAAQLLGKLGALVTEVSIPWHLLAGALWLPIGVEGLTQTMMWSHHPAMAIPCGMSDGLPVSMMLVGKHFDEPTIYRAAYAFEQAGDWKQM